MIDLSPLHLEEATHTYRWQGQVVPGVTSILARLGYLSGIPRDILDAAMARGTRVHTACELDDLGELNEAKAADVMGYVRAWRSWQEHHAAHWQLIEQPLYHPTLCYAGKPDRLGLWARPEQPVSKRRRVLVDLKSGPFHPVMDAQLAAYGGIAMAMETVDLYLQDHLVVQLNADGTYHTHERTEAQIQAGWALFVSLLSVHNWSMRHL